MGIARSNNNLSNEAPVLIPLPVAVDFIRFEKNLLQIGFFGAHDTRHNNQSTRRIEQIVNRDGQKIKVSAEFRASQEFGLPSTSDRDKYIAFMRVAMEERTKHGQISNPIRFTGYRLLKELGLTYSGENYEDINRWGQRMADTTITSEQVIYLAARKRYANKTVHVFRSFTRAGQSNLDDTGRIESYEVVLEDWLLENLNQSYVIPEDFNAYRKLKRPTAKGIFGYLHLWFHASHGRQIEKDYAELCILLNIPIYRHVSKIRDTMGRSLNELVDVGYLSQWDIKPMSTKDGYKLVLLPGEELLHVLAISQRKQIDGESDGQPNLSDLQVVAVNALLERAISPAKANSLIRQYDPEAIVDQIEYAEHLISRERRRKFDNPAGFIIYAIENQIPVPTTFMTSRRLREQKERTKKKAEQDGRVWELQLEYEQWIEQQVEKEIAIRYAGPELKNRIKQVIKHRVRTDERFSRMALHHQEALALQFLRRDIQAESARPSFEEWCEQTHQRKLFRSQTPM
jgi:replication initiator protein A